MYNQRCPVVSLRLTPERKFVLDTYRYPGESYGDAYVRAVDEMDRIDSVAYKARAEGYARGWAQARKYIVRFPCWKCGGLVPLDPYDTYWMDRIARFLIQNRWGHEWCPR